MLEPKRENKNNGPERKPWSIKSFPVGLRRKFVASAVTKGVTAQAELEDVVEKHLKGSKKK